METTNRFTRLPILGAAAAGLLALAASVSVQAQAQAPAGKPNIVVIMSDDVGIWNIGA